MAIPKKISTAAQEADDALASLLNPQPAGDVDASAGNDPDSSAGDGTGSEQAAETVEKTTAPNVENVATTVAQSPTSAEFARMQQQYATLQGMFDQQRAELAEAKGRVDTLTTMVKPQQPAVPPKPTRLTTDTEVEEFGADFTDFVKRASGEDWKPMLAAIERRLERLEIASRDTVQTLQTTSAAVAKTAEERYQDALTRAVPDWQNLDRDPGFIDWLAQEDVFSGAKRHDMLLQAHNSLDAPRVSKFFNAYLQESGKGGSPAPAAKSETPSQRSIDPASLVSPTTANGSSAGVPSSGGKRVYTAKDVDKLYDDRMKGRITQTEFAKREADILAAVQEGRIKD